MSKKRIYIFIAILILLAVAGWLIFYFFFGGQAPTTQGGGTFPAPPTGSGAGSDTETGIPQKQPSQSVSANSIPALRRLTDVPVAGGVAGVKNSVVIARYMERGTGHILEIPVNSDTASRLSNTTIPKIYEAYASKDGLSFVARYLREGSEDIQTFSAKVQEKGGVTGGGELVGTFLPPNIRSLALSPDGSRAFYLTTTASGSTGTASDTGGSKKVQIFSSPLRELTVSWPTNGTVAVATKASAGQPGLLFFLNSTTGALQTVLRDITGLLTLTSPDASEVLFSQSTNGGVALSVYNKSKGVVTPISLATFPEKCLWSKKTAHTVLCAVPSSLPSGEYPDDWYQGLVGFSDDIWKIDTATGSVSELFALKNYTPESVDAVRLFTDPTEAFLFFINKRDGALWALKLAK